MKIKDVLGKSRITFFLAGILWFTVDITICILTNQFGQFLADIFLWVPVFLITWFVSKKYFDT